MSEELLQKGYVSRKGIVKGDPIGPYEGFNLGATTLDQLRRYGIIPDRSYGKNAKKKPDGIVVDRRSGHPIVKFVVEFKDRGGLDSEVRVKEFSEKVADEYCRPLLCELGGVSDHTRNSWLLVTPEDWRFIRREDDYPLDYPIDLAADDGRSLLARTFLRLESNLNKPRAALVPFDAVNPTRLAEQTWQDIWLACGEQPEACLATFIEVLIFKFLSDLGVLRANPSGIPVDFDTVIRKNANLILRYYFDNVRPEIRRLFPAGDDGTSVINGIVFNPKSGDQGKLFLQILERFRDFGSLKKIDPEFKSRIFERFLKKNLSVKNWGQYFTPRNVVKAMVEMSGIEHLPPGAVVADPACGVGGFILEPLMNKRPHDFRSTARALHYVGWDRDDKTIILANKVFPIERFKGAEHWLVNKWWPLEDRERLGDVDAEAFVGRSELADMLRQTAGDLSKQAATLDKVEREVPIHSTVTMSLSDKRYFRMSIGKRVLKRDLFNAARGTSPFTPPTSCQGVSMAGWQRQTSQTSLGLPCSGASIPTSTLRLARLMRRSQQLTTAAGWRSLIRS